MTATLRRKARRLHTELTCNWFTIALTCAIRGHQWADQRNRCTTVRACTHCGLLMGYRSRCRHQGDR